MSPLLGSAITDLSRDSVVAEPFDPAGSKSGGHLFEAPLATPQRHSGAVSRHEPNSRIEAPTRLPNANQLVKAGFPHGREQAHPPNGWPKSQPGRVEAQPYRMQYPVHVPPEEATEMGASVEHGNRRLTTADVRLPSQMRVWSHPTTLPRSDFDRPRSLVSAHHRPVKEPATDASYQNERVPGPTRSFWYQVLAPEDSIAVTLGGMATAAAERGPWGRLLVRRDADIGGGEPKARFVGGMRFGWTGLGNWTHPFVALRLYDTGIELGPAAKWLSGLVPVWRSRLDELAVVEPVGQASPDPVQPWPNFEWTRGVRFITNDGSCASFWCYRRNEVLERLAESGLQVEDRPTRFRFFDPASGEPRNR